MPSETANTLNNNTSQDDKDKKQGSRIFYVDPNDVYGTSNGIPLTPDYTDLCVSFDLQVETVPRTGYVTGRKDESDNLGKDVTETYHFFWNSYQANSDPKDNYVSFTRGQDYLDRSYMTTYYTGINFNDFRNRDIVEGLGVESVSIAFENYYMPTIKMRFIDVRGASLFGREEATHGDNQITQDSIWGCFFTFPYPKFRLQVKGFFGHPISYQLTCLDFRANFDSKTGNFVIDVTFVGYDYGIMSDIPTAYLMAAPYSRYVGMDYWIKQCSTNENWKLSDGNPPNTLFEIKSNINSFIREAQKTKDGTTINDGSNGADDADAVRELNELRGVKEAYNEIVKTLTYKPLVLLKRGVVYKLKYKGLDYYLFSTINNDGWKRIVDKTANFYKKLKEYKSNFPHKATLFNNKELVFGREIEEDEPIGDENGKVIKFDCNSANETITPKTNLRLDQKSIISSLPYSSLLSDIWKTSQITDIEIFNNVGFSKINAGFAGMQLGDKEGYQILPAGKTEQLLDEIENQIVSQLEKRAEIDMRQQDETDSLYSRLDIYNAVGILPTIENVFKTIMCHLETFMYMVYECKNRIDKQINDNLRTPEKLGIQGYTFQDYKIPEGETKPINIPPWVAVCVDEKRTNTGIKENDYVQTVGWVGDFEGETEWEEAKFIDGLTLGTLKIFSSDTAPKETYYGDASVYTLPTDIFSTVFPGVANNNPTSIGEYLAMRASALFGVVGYKQNAADALGKADALNFLKKVGQEHIKSQFVKSGGNWHSIVKNAPTLFVAQETDENQRVYGYNPGCEGVNAKILTPTGNEKYRYTYTEIVNRKNEMDKTGIKRYGVVYIPVDKESMTLGSASSNSPFISSVFKNGDKPIYRGILVNLYRDDAVRVYHKCSTDMFLSLNGSNGDNLFTVDSYNNEAMFNIIGGSDFADTAEKIKESYGRLDADILTVDVYEDTDTTWRKTLKEYWNLENDDYLISGLLPESRYSVYDNESGSDGFIFFNRIIYNQNIFNLANERDKDDIEAAKCILFLSSSGYDITRVASLFQYGSKEHVFESVPYGAVLLLGGLLWRAEQENGDCVRWFKNDIPENDYQKYTTLTSKAIENESEIAKGSSLKWKTVEGLGYVLDVNLKGEQYKLYPNGIDTNIKNKLIKEFKHYLSNPDGWEKVKQYEIKHDGNQFFDANTFESWYKEQQSTDDGKQALEKRKEAFYSDEYVTSLDRQVILTYGSLTGNDDVNTEVTIDKSCWEAYAEAFCSKLEEIAAYSPNYESDIPMEEKNKEKDMKRAMYLYMKRIWDRWLMMSSPEKFKVQNYMKNFVFMDSFYRNIGTLLHINCEKLSEALENINGESMMWQLISKITTDHHCMFFALPDYFGFGDDDMEQTNAKNKGMSPEMKLQDMFKPIPFSKKEKMETSNKYIVMFAYDHNENLAHINDYSDDGFDIYSHDGNNVLPETFNVPPYSSDLALPDIPSEERRVKRYGYNIPSFGVTFGRMNNHLFKNVSIGMTNPISTEQSINALSLLAQKGGGNEKSVCYYGQDLFPVYNGYSYDCTVEMMGNVQIMPLMYFQLLNMPMFRGTYMIYSVTHTMRPGDMTTTFKGMKLSRFAAPFAEGWYVAMTKDGIFFDSQGNLTFVDECSEYGNEDYKLRTGEKEMLISNNTGITRNPKTDTYQKLNDWQTSLTIRVHTNTFQPGQPQDYRYQLETTIDIVVNKWLKEDIEQIFKTIFETKVGNKYFAIKQVACYNDKPNDRRFIHNNQNPNSKVLSYHAYGAAIDINWDANPLRRYDGKEDDWMVMRTDNHPVVKIFKNLSDIKHKYNWGWGGDWKGTNKDYMHFSLFDGK